MSDILRRMRLGLSLGVAALAVAAFAPQALAWDHCGVGAHRAVWNFCISNYAVGPGTRGCPFGYHIGRYTYACFPNRF